MTDTPENIDVPVTFFMDYQCPFSYLGHMRLKRLKERYPLEIHVRYIETQPSNGAGEIVPAVNDNAQSHWLENVERVEKLCAEEDVPFQRPGFVTNTRRACLLGIACTDHHPDRFEALYDALFKSYFVYGQNIGQEKVLVDLLEALNLKDLSEVAWSTPKYFQALLRHVEKAQRLELEGIPSLRVSRRVFTGADAVALLEKAMSEGHA